VHAAAVDAELTMRQAEANRINIELLKGEVRALERRLEELGMAFAPATGLVGAGARFAELREAVYGLERRIRNLSLPQPSPPPPAADVAPTSTLFNYVGFERRFRGDPQEIVGALQERYADLLAAHPPVVDIGCGRGELLEALAAQGVEVIGVEPDPGMVAEGRGRGLTIAEADAGSFLRAAADFSLGSIISTHVVEHLELDDLIEMLELAVRKLAPGGVFIAETPNPASLIVLGNSYILDPTHVRPLHPSLLAFLSESAGFRDVRLRFYAPATAYHLPPVEAPDAPAWAEPMLAGVNDAFRRLNEVLFGPQEYAVVATTPATSAVPPGRDVPPLIKLG
jgi:SAM-dependent methyltransferase